MNLIYIAILALGAFVAIWMLFVVPAERKHHERKLAALRKQIEKVEEAKQEDRKYAEPDDAGELSTDDSRSGE